MKFSQNFNVIDIILKDKKFVRVLNIRISDVLERIGPTAFLHARMKVETEAVSLQFHTAVLP